MLSLQIGDACAAGPYDGEWKGSATGRGGRCKPAIMLLTVEGKVVTGQARFDGDVANISGTVLEDGGVGATIGFRHLTGSFPNDMFEGFWRVSVAHGKSFSKSRTRHRCPRPMTTEKKIV